MIKSAVHENLEKDVKYTYFVNPSEFKMSDVDNLIDKNSPLRKNIEIVMIDSKHFKTFFTFHFKDDDQLESLYMTSLLPHRNDLLIQISDPDHIKRIKERILKQRGEKSNANNIEIHDFTVG